MKVYNKVPEGVPAWRECELAEVKSQVIEAALEQDGLNVAQLLD